MNLPTFDIFIKPIDFRELKSDLWNDDPVPASLKINKKRVEIDLSYRGSHIREFIKKSYHISLFNFKGLNELHLNAEYKDPSLIRNKLSLDFFTSIGCLSPSSKHVFLSINGKAEGVYLQLESVDHNFLKKRNLPHGPIFYAINDDANFSLVSPIDNKAKTELYAGYERKTGLKSDSLILAEFIYLLNTTGKQEFETTIPSWLDIKQYFKWLAGVVCTQNYDGFVHNYALYRNEGTGLYEILPWDYDATWGRDINGLKMRYDYLRIEGFNTLTARLLDIDKFRKQYKEIMRGILDENFTVEAIEPQIHHLHSTIRPYLTQDPYVQDRIDIFDKEPDFILQFLKDRQNYLRKHLKDLD
ncbi:spore coat protein [Neobacillus piezotolerans]|uniref:Spore coat protein n=1 Tax=Neobacillus piezotolerans TaxID=2259171 RepID=A0A3D8GLQ2_9BACI|nr:CotH kinase family protein [Neobacillus piezotolerans]RDU35363.1 spore coat protein [Neobacillus piezotolerans]